MIFGLIRYDNVSQLYLIHSFLMMRFVVFSSHHEEFVKGIPSLLTVSLMHECYHS